MDKRHVTRFLNLGEIIFSSNIYFENQYKMMEIKNAFINDPDEGAIRFNQTTPIDTETASEIEKGFLKNHFGYDSETGPRALFSGNTISERTKPFFMACFTKVGPPLGSSVFCQPQSGYPPYDACVKISHVDEFLHELWFGVEKATVFPTENEIDLNRCFDSKLCANHVRYSPINLDWSSGFPYPGPFLKDSSFAVQNEFRAVITPTVAVNCERILVRSPGICRYLTRAM